MLPTVFNYLLKEKGKSRKNKRKHEGSLYFFLKKLFPDNEDEKSVGKSFRSFLETVLNTLW